MDVVSELDLSSVYTFNILSIPRHSSLDPLEGDRLKNAVVQRMLYHTPLEVNIENELTSHVLSEFSYSKATRTVHWVVKKNIYFSDGLPITVDDIAFSVARMAFTHSKFPVISDIVGLNEWVIQGSPLESLPKGITIRENSIFIVFNGEQPNPLFRFTLELFSIIPARVVDKETNTIKGIPPSSGYYILVSEAEEGLEFRKIKSTAETHKIEGPKKVIFRYIDDDEIKKLFREQHSVIFGHDVSLMNNSIDLKKMGFQLSQSQNANYLGILLNPRVEPFENINCRRVFATKMRLIAQDIYGKTQTISSSVFPKIVPGFLDDQSLKNTIDYLLDNQTKNCFKDSAPLVWHSLGETFYNELIYRTAKSLQLKLLSPKKVVENREIEELFNRGETPFSRFGSGFWALDPVGDTKMMFTKGLHPAIDVLTEDVMVQEKIDQLDTCNSERDQRVVLEGLNAYLYQQSIINVFLNFGYFYGTVSSNAKLDPPYAVQTPYPWQVLSLLQETKN